MGLSAATISSASGSDDKLVGHILDPSMFEFMLGPPELGVVDQFINEELMLLEGLLSVEGSQYQTLIGVGDGAQCYRGLAASLNLRYVCIDPYLRSTGGFSAGTAGPEYALLISRRLEDVDIGELPHGAALWVFH